MFDVAIAGAGTAGLSAALVLGRARRNVLLLDAGSTRNEPAEAAHGFFTQDGTPPLELLRLGREHLKPYPVQVWEAEVNDARPAEAGFELTLADGRNVSARKLILATGVVDDLPEVPGIHEHWGRGVFHCPYSHGWEVQDRPWAILYRGFMAFEGAALFLGWARDLTLLTNAEFGLEDSERKRLLGLGVKINEQRIVALRGAADAHHLESITFEDGQTVPFTAMFVAPGQRLRSSLAASLDCRISEVGPARFPLIEANPMTGETTTPGVYAAGDSVTAPAQSLILAAASGARAAYFSNHSLAIEDAERALTASPAGRD